MAQPPVESAGSPGVLTRALVGGHTPTSQLSAPLSFCRSRAVSQRRAPTDVLPLHCRPFRTQEVEATLDKVVMLFRYLQVMKYNEYGMHSAE